MDVSALFTTPAHALFGFGRIVYDPTNHAENLLTAARTLEQINNQITSLQNEAQMLINQARNLASLPHSSLQALQQNVQRTQQLLGEAQNIAFDVQRSTACSARLRQALPLGHRQPVECRCREPLETTDAACRTRCESKPG